VAALASADTDAFGAGARSWTLDPALTKRILRTSAVPHACPQPRLHRYRLIQEDGPVARVSAYCAGPMSQNGFYGHGIVNADAVFTAG
jgi:hypothetical protein